MNRPVFPLQDQLRGFSRALFSTWIYHRRFNILFDAGEGISSYLLNRVFGIRKIFLSHGHADHIAGLTNLINIRNLGAGDQTAQLIIYYPRNNQLIELMRDYLSRTQSDLSFDLVWQPIDDNTRVELNEKRGKIYLQTFRTQHSHKQLSLGFNIVEIRRKLLPKFQGLPQQEINEAIWQHGNNAVAENIEQIIFSYGGDSRPIRPELVKNSLFLCHECTYMNIDDDERNFHQHSILDEVFETAASAQVKTLLLFHVSLRYSQEEIREYLRQAMKRHAIDFRVIVLHGDRIIDTAYNGSFRRWGDRSYQKSSFEKDE